MIRAWVLAVAALCAGCRPAIVLPEQASVILISIDGWRWDYIDRFAPPNVARLAGEGVRAEGLIPQFPSKTFPNHYTIVTGLRPANHGIISNNMRDAGIPGEFSLSDRVVQSDSRWWQGEPIWNTAEKQGRVAAAMFWPGSEAVIGGGQATHWMPFDDRMPHADRVRRVLDWLKLPEGKRPAFLTLYYSDVDTAGHSFGPDSNEVRDAVQRVDASIGELVQGVEAIGLADRVHYIIVSDHGMAALSSDRVIVLDDYIDISSADIVDWSPVLGLSPKDGDVETLYPALKGKHPHMAVYRSGELPAEYGLAGHPRLPAIVGIADDGWNIISRADVRRWSESRRGPPGGQHGYDARAKSMLGLFVAHGPRLRRGLVVQPFENIHVYELMCALLGVTPAKNDGDPAVTRDMLR